MDAAEQHRRYIEEARCWAAAMTIWARAVTEATAQQRQDLRDEAERSHRMREETCNHITRAQLIKSARD